ncbi:hypothetical protein [Deferrisoma palaeochoriense]
MKQQARWMWGLGVLLLVLGMGLGAGVRPAQAAAGPNWMPNFPMRLGAAGAMGMWMPVPGASEYKVYRKIGQGEWEVVYKGPMNNFQDPTAPADQDVAYKVTAVVGGAETDPSPVAVLKGQKPIEPPKELTFRLDAINKAVHLRWGLSEGASFYNVYRADAPDQAGTLLGSVQEPKHTDAKVEDGKTYYYFVTAVSTTGQESKRGEPLKVEVKFPKIQQVKQFEFKAIVMKLVKTTRGEEFDEFQNPSDILFHNGRLYVACQDGVQVLDADGNYLERLPLLQEKVGSREWSRPWMMGVSADGNLLFSFLGDTAIREVNPAGDALVREIVVPPMEGMRDKPGPVGIAQAPDGALWVVDGNYGLLEIFSRGATEPERVGFPRVSSEKYDPAKHGDRFIAPSRPRFLPAFPDWMFVLESGEGRLSAVDLQEHKKVFSILGIGGARNQVSQLSDFSPYDDSSILIVDSLRGEIKQVKVTKPGDDTNGDYLANLVDDPEGKTPKLQSMSANPTIVQFDPQRRRLYVLSVQGKEVAVYDLP